MKFWAFNLFLIRILKHFYFIRIIYGFYKHTPDFINIRLKYKLYTDFINIRLKYKLYTDFINIRLI
jgi:hypothetical protein